MKSSLREKDSLVIERAFSKANRLDDAELAVQSDECDGTGRRSLARSRGAALEPVVGRA